MNYKITKKQARKIEKLLLNIVPELEQVEDTWKRFKGNDWESIHFGTIEGLFHS